MTAFLRRGLKRCLDYLGAKDMVIADLRVKPSIRTAVDITKGHAERSLEAACILRDARLPEEALPLYQKTFLLSAQNAMHLNAASTTPHEPLLDERPHQLPQDGISDVRFEQIQAWLGQQKFPPKYDRLELLLRNESEISRREAQYRCDQLDEMIRRLQTNWQLASPQRVRRVQAARWAVLLVSCVLLVVGFQAWRLFPRNVAYQKSVTASSIISGKDLAGIVDDYYYGNPAFVSKREAQPWVVIDLGKPYMVTDAQVVARHDCCFAEPLPLDFQVSLDNKTFVTVATKIDPFVSLVPWVVPAIMRKARYVRVRSQKRAVLALCEVVVFGRSL